MNFLYLIPLPALLFSLFFIIGSVISYSVNRKGRLTSYSIIVLVLLLLDSSYTLYPLIFGLPGLIIGRFTRTPFRLLKLAVYLVLIDIGLLFVTQLIAKAGITRKIPSFDQLFSPDLVYFYFTEIIVSSLILVFVLFALYFLFRFFVSKHIALCLAMLPAYFVEPFLHIEHPQYGYSLNPLSFLNISWILAKIIIILLSFLLGSVVQQTQGITTLLTTPSFRARVLYVALYFFVYHSILQSFVLSDGEILYGITLTMLAATTLLIGAVIGNIRGQSI